MEIVQKKELIIEGKIACADVVSITVASSSDIIGVDFRNCLSQKMPAEVNRFTDSWPASCNEDLSLIIGLSGGAY